MRSRGVNRIWKRGFPNQGGLDKCRSAEVSPEAF